MINGIIVTLVDSIAGSRIAIPRLPHTTRIDDKAIPVPSHIDFVAQPLKRTLTCFVMPKD
jgi:hypothetical protein